MTVSPTCHNYKCVLIGKLSGGRESAAAEQIGHIFSHGAALDLAGSAR